MKSVKTLVILLTCIISFQSYHAQDEIPISTTTVVGCGGFLVDTGLSASSYGNNENFTMTLCAEDPETILNLYFNLFALGDGDSMTIYDGDDTSDPLIGVFTELDLLNQDVTSTNVDGCLTLVWETDASDVGNFTAEISCGLPCQQPVVSATIDQDLPVLLCIGEEFTLDGSSSILAEGTAIDQFTWSFGDGNEDSESWPQVSYSFPEAGSYVIGLEILDDNECGSTNVLDLIVQVGTVPEIIVTDDFTMCPGDEVTVDAEIIPLFWDGAVGGISGGELFIPDDQSTCFESEISFSNFPAGSSISDPSDLEFFYINFEHSFMGDLTIAFECPEGNVLTVHAQGGGGTWLGEPVDDDSDLSPGVGYDYWWSPDASLGTWEEEAGTGTLPSDTYDSWQTWDALLGCSLNGTWSIEICDSWGSDNGFIFDWTVEFDESFYSQDLSFTPSFGAQCDSTSWSPTSTGVNVTSDCNQIFFDPNVPAGDYEFTYTAVDNFGCEYSESMNVTINPPAPNFTLSDEEFCIENEDYFIFPIGSNPDNYDWVWNDNTTGTSVLYTEPGIYSFTASNICGESTDDAFVEGIICEVVIPNIFTPNNGDALNENFVITGLEYFPGSKLIIFNRWGNEVYSDDDYKNNWSPTLSEASEGTYYYVLELLNKDSEYETHSGSFQILR